MPAPCGHCHAIGMTQCGAGGCVPHGACPADDACTLGSTSCALPSATNALGYAPPACVHVPIGDYSCSCASGWTGTNCDSFDDCASSPCGKFAQPCRCAAYGSIVTAACGLYGS